MHSSDKHGHSRLDSQGWMKDKKECKSKFKLLAALDYLTHVVSLWVTDTVASELTGTYEST